MEDDVSPEGVCTERGARMVSLYHSCYIKCTGGCLMLYVGHIDDVGVVHPCAVRTFVAPARQTSRTFRKQQEMK